MNNDNNGIKTILKTEVGFGPQLSTFLLAAVCALWHFGNFFLLKAGQHSNFLVSFFVMAAVFGVLALDRWYTKMRYVIISLFLEQVGMYTCWSFYRSVSAVRVSHMSSLAYSGYLIIIPILMMVAGLAAAAISGGLRSISGYVTGSAYDEIIEDDNSITIPGQRVHKVKAKVKKKPKPVPETEVEKEPVIEYSPRPSFSIEIDPSAASMVRPKGAPAAAEPAAELVEEPVYEIAEEPIVITMLDNSAIGDTRPVDLSQVIAKPLKKNSALLIEEEEDTEEAEAENKHTVA